VAWIEQLIPARTERYVRAGSKQDPGLRKIHEDSPTEQVEAIDYCRCCASLFFSCLIMLAIKSIAFLLYILGQTDGTFPDAL
jgi:hypothetical protein